MGISGSPSDDADEPTGPGSDAVASGAARTLTVGGVVVALLGAGWFILSHFVMGTTSPDAVGEALGVMLGLLVAASIAGAIVSGRGSHG